MVVSYLKSGQEGCFCGDFTSSEWARGAVGTGRYFSGGFTPLKWDSAVGGARFCVGFGSFRRM